MVASADAILGDQEASMTVRGNLILYWALALMLCPACLRGAGAALSEPLTAAERADLDRLKLETIRDVTTALASGEMQGRGTASPGGTLAARYIAERFCAIGLEPAGDKGSFEQRIRFKSYQVLPTSTARVGDLSFRLGADFLVPPPYGAKRAAASGELVFVGFGAVVPKLGRDDLRGVDVKGKIVVLLDGTPEGVDRDLWEQLANRRSILLGLLRRGAGGFIVVGAESEQQSFAELADYLLRRRVALAEAPEVPMPPTIWLSNEAASRMFERLSLSYTELRRRANLGSQPARKLDGRASLDLRVSKSEGYGSNVAGLLRGSDARLQAEAVVVSAHYDAYGTQANGTVYAGAVDNALGVARMVAIAEVLASAATKPRRSVIFIALTGQEHGRLGSAHWTRNPTWPLRDVVADITAFGCPLEVEADIGLVVGYGATHSTMGETLELAANALDITVIDDPIPQYDLYRHTDAYSFAAAGIPSLMLLGGPQEDVGAIVERTDRWLRTVYHQPSDVVGKDWKWEGSRQVASIEALLLLRTANADRRPTWLRGSPYWTPAGNKSSTTGDRRMETATLAGGCFWCLEAVFSELRGVDKVVSGYSGGHTVDPDYKSVCTGSTGHAEAVQVTFDPQQISYSDLLYIFFAMHDPTTLNRQGPDSGTQYRSAVFYHSDEQRDTARRVMADLTAQQLWPDPIVTELTALEKFYPAEDYHQDYFARNSAQPYCQAIIAPKVAKLRKQFLEKLAR
jgi:peptide-methionine (S)-S-oxide reductase